MMRFYPKTKVVSLKLPQELNDKLDYYAGVLGKAKSELMREAIIALVKVLEEVENEQELRKELNKKLKKEIKDTLKRHNIIFV